MTPYERQKHRNALRGNPLLPEMLARTEAEIVEAWKTAESPERRERLHAELAALTRFRELLESEIRRNE